jgi:hypothetical protein
MTVSRDNPTIDELLCDPVTRAVMKADRVDPSALEAMLRSVARTIASDGGGGALQRAFDRQQSKISRYITGAPHLRLHHCGAP